MKISKPLAMIGLVHQAAAAAIAAVNRAIERDIKAAFGAGKDFIHGPLESGFKDAFSVRPLFEPAVYEIEIKGGAVEPGTYEDEDGKLIIPQGWTLYRRADLSEGELARLLAGRLDWRDADWEDCCGLPDCEQCDGCRS